MKLPLAKLQIVLLLLSAQWLVAQSSIEQDQKAILYESSSPTLTNGFQRGVNWHSQRGVPLSSTVGNPVGSDGRSPAVPAPTRRQFQGIVFYSGVTRGSTPKGLDSSRSFAANADNLNWPRGLSKGSVVLVLRSQVGAPYVSRQVSFLFGSIITPPKSDENGVPIAGVDPSDYWLAEPHPAVSPSYYWSPHANAVFANQPGSVRVTWRKAKPEAGVPTDLSSNPDRYYSVSGLYYSLTNVDYVVSGTAVKPPRKIYWTEGTFRATGKPVAVPSARVSAIKIAFNKAFPERVSTEFVAPGQSLLVTDAASRLQELRTLWHDFTQGQIFAYNREGRVFVELLGDPIVGRAARQHLGFEIVDIFQQPTPLDVMTELGEKLTPYSDRDDNGLVAEPILQAGLQQFTYQQAEPGATKATYYGVRETVNLNDVLVHWTEAGVEGLRWPSIYSRYKLAWPVAVEKYSHYLRPLAATKAEARLTAIPLPTDNAPIIQYQDALDRPRGELTEKFEYFTWLDRTYPAHRGLLRFTSGNNVAFERVFSWLDVNLKTMQFANSVATNLNSWRGASNTFNWTNQTFTAPRVVSSTVPVGRRIAPPSGELGASADSSYLAGFIHQPSGTSFSPNAYKNPFVVGFNEAQLSAIIPVNAVPGANTLDIWWFRSSASSSVRNEANGFKPVLWPSVIGRYTLVWPGDASEIILASNDGSGALESLQAAGKIYVQNNPSQPGYNPNEEHALMLGGQAFALRDDLNVTSASGYSSDPFVLLEFSQADGRPDMRLFKVLREKPEAGIIFDFITMAGGNRSQSGAGRPLQPPMPLPFLPPPVEGTGANAINYNTESASASGDLPTNWNESRDGQSGSPVAHYKRFTWKDRKENFWAYRGVHAGPPPFAAGSYNATNTAFGPLRQARALKDAPFTYAIHTSRLEDSLTLVPLAATPLPAGLTINGLTITGTPTQLGTNVVQLVVSDVADNSRVTNSLTISVVSTGTPVTQGRLAVIDKTLSGASVTYVGRPPYLTKFPAGTNSFTMRFYYKSQEGFAWPGVASPPAVGAIVPYLRPKDSNGATIGDATSKTNALPIVYRPVWAPDPPKMQFGDTLTVAKSGLVSVRGQSSVQLLYQQSIARNVTASNDTVVLHDPTREKTRQIRLSDLARLPASIRVNRYQGKVYFPNLPPHLGNRFFFDPDRGGNGALVLRGEFKDEIVGEKYLLLNVLRGSDLAAVKALVPITDTDNKSRWDSAVDALSTTMQTFYEDPKVPGQYVVNPAQNTNVGVESLARVADDDVAVDSYALSASGPGSGYVSLIVGDSVGRRLLAPGEPVSVYVLKVEGSLYPGELKVIPSANPLNEMLTLQHSADLAGKFSDYEYEWKIAPPVDGVPPANLPGGYQALIFGTNLPRHTLGGRAGIQVLVDNYVIMRYRPTNPNHPLYTVKPSDADWSSWTTPQLAEGWIKRVLAGINPFNQRVTDLFNNSVNTEASILTQAGRRWEGDVALNMETINDFGLIEIYETVINRGKGLSIDAGINFGPANDALLLAAGYLNDLYMMLGNEAWADAANPTIGIGTKDKTYGDIATALFAFQGQVPTLLDEELALLRGRDDFLQPGVNTQPVYNRMFWNFTRGINAGEVIYSLNYNIQPNPAAGTTRVGIGAADAARMFPQGHGDAYGHYLTALKGYYHLLLNNNFEWVPRTEAVTVLGKAVQVDYLDERKFAAAAAAAARSGRQIFDLSWRKDYRPGAGAGWEHFAETRSNPRRQIVNGGETNNPVRHWGVDHWANRVTQGAYINWIVGNAILPGVDPDPTHEGIQRIDRTVVPELRELATLGEGLQTTLDNAEGHLTPLGLPEGSLAFDINPNTVVGASPETQFEQVYARSKSALNNAVAAFDDSKDVTRLMRSEEDSLADFQNLVARQELSYTNALIELYGTPYPNDVGPGKTYKQDYAGPDFLHFGYVEDPTIEFLSGGKQVIANSFDLVTKVEIKVYDDKKSQIGGINNDVKKYALNSETVAYTFSSDGFMRKPSDWTSRRKSPGKIQESISRIFLARNAALQALTDYKGQRARLEGLAKLFNEQLEAYATRRGWAISDNISASTAESVKKAVELAITIIDKYTRWGLDDVKETALEALPKSTIVGVASGGDLMSPARASIEATIALQKAAISGASIAGQAVAGAAEVAGNIISRLHKIREIMPLENKLEFLSHGFELEMALEELRSRLVTISGRLVEMESAGRNYATLVAEGDRIQQEREVYRQRASAVIQGFRTRDAAFRIFRNEKLERYKTLFDLASSYAYLALNAYDYETGLLHTPAGKEFLSRVVSARALGVVRNGEPQFAGSDTGDSGLSSILAETKADWDVLKGRLGFNNPDAYGTTVSLRTENLRILPGTEGEQPWQDVLHQSRRANLLDDEDVRRYCMQIDSGNGLPVPGLLLDFSTVIANGYNLFGRTLAAGDQVFSPSSFATKIFAVGVALEGYRGMNNPAVNAGAVNAAGAISPADPSAWFLDPQALAGTPYVYLIPVGLDSMRSPPLGDVSVVRTWSVDDVTVPMPFNIGASGFSTAPRYQSSDSLSEPLFGFRKHQAFRPVSTLGAFSGNIFGVGGQLQPSQYTNRRLIGRSVWNSRWKLVIPGYTLLGNPDEGLDRFIQTVKDVKLHFVTYSYAGN